MKVHVAALALLSGCAQLLGLENTKFEQRDAAADAPSVCDGAPACVATTARSVCGLVMQTGANAGAILRSASPTGQNCTTVGSMEGPCALAIFGQPMTSYFAGSTADRIVGQIDDCGRFVVPDIAQSVEDVAVVVTGTDVAQSAVVVLDRETAIGTDKNVALPVVTTAAALAWGTQINAGNPPDVTGSYLVKYVSALGVPIATEELRVNGAAVGDPPVQPWGAYFSGSQPFGTIDAGLGVTQDNGSALVVPATGSFQLGGFRTGKNCTPVTLQAVPSALIHVTLSC